MAICSNCRAWVQEGAIHFCYNAIRYPFKCPVCEGRGTVPAGFYFGVSSTQTAPETCKACGGGGVLWG